MLCQIALLCVLVTAQSDNVPAVVSGVVLDSQDRPVAAAIVDARSAAWMDADIVIEPKTTKTDTDGKFRFELPLDQKELGRVTLSAHNEDQTELGYYPISLLDEHWSEEVRIRLSESQTIRLQVLDMENRPIAGATTGLTIRITGQLIRASGNGMGDHVFLQPRTTDSAGNAEYRIPGGAEVLKGVVIKQGYSLAYREYATTSLGSANRSGGDFWNPPASFPASGTDTLVIAPAPSIAIRVLGENQQPIAGASVFPLLAFDSVRQTRISYPLLLGNAIKQPTNASGEVDFSWLPQSGWMLAVVEAESYADRESRFDLNGATENLEIEIQPFVAITGRVQAEGGESLAGVRLTALGIDHSTYAYRMYSAISDAEGAYSMNVPAGKIYQVIVNDRDWVAPVQTNIMVAAGNMTRELNFSARKATRVFGRVTYEESDNPIANVPLRVTYRDDSALTTDFEGFVKPEDNARPRTGTHEFVTTTDAEGRYAFALGDGKYRIAMLDSSAGVQDFEIWGQDSLEIDLWTEVQVMRYRLSGQITEQASGQPLPWARVRMAIPNHLPAYVGTTDRQGRFEVKLTRATRGGVPQDFPLIEAFAVSADGKLTGNLQLVRRVDRFTLPLAPPITIVGELIGPDADIPWGGAQVSYRRTSSKPMPATDGDVGRVVTDDSGIFRLENMTIGQTYELFYEPEVAKVQTGNRRSGPVIQQVSLGRVTVTSEDSEIIKFRIPVPRGPADLPSTDERLKRLFASIKDPLQAFELATAESNDRPLVVLFGVADDPRLQELIKSRLFQHGEVVDPFREYRLLLIAKNSNEASAVASELGETLDETKELIIVLLDRDNKKHRTIKSDDILLRDSLSLPKLEQLLKIPQ